MSYQQQGGQEQPREAQGGAEQASQMQSTGASTSQGAQGGAEVAYQATGAAATGMGGTVEQVSGWTLGFVTFAGVMLIMGGIFWFFAGLSTVIEPDLQQLSRAYAFDMSTDTWGWIHMIGGIVAVICGFYVFTGNILARLLGIFVALVSAVINFAYIPYYPVWSLMIIAIDIGVIWALATYSHEKATGLTEGY